jgi:hypothetical protein
MMCDYGVQEEYLKIVNQRVSALNKKVQQPGAAAMVNNLALAGVLAGGLPANVCV